MGVNYPILRIGLSGFSPLEHYRLGQCMARAVDKLGRKAVFVASGDLSHKLKDDGPYGYAPEGPAFDRWVTQAMADGDFLQFLTTDPGLCDRAAECGLRSFQIMAGAFVSLHAHGQLRGCIGTTGPTTESAAWEIVQNACELDEGQAGLCRGRGCQDGNIVPLNYGKLTSLALDPIEEKPLRRPGP